MTDHQHPQASDADYRAAVTRLSRTVVTSWRILGRLVSTDPRAVVGAIDALETCPRHARRRTKGRTVPEAPLD